MPASVSPRILIVEDEASIAETVVYALKTEGFEPRWVTTGAEAFAAMREGGVTLVVLDLGLPDMSGFDVCRELRRLGTVPIVFLTARAGEIDRIVGLELGADDYMAKPFSPRELTARIRAILRRARSEGAGDAAAAGSSVKTAGPTAEIWKNDAARCRIEYRGKPLELTRNEYRLLSAFVAAPGRVFSREQLMALAWEDPGAATDRTVDAHVKSVRAKLRQAVPEADPIVTHRGLGYSLREES